MNFLKNICDGRYSLAKTFWLYGLLPLAIYAGLIASAKHQGISPFALDILKIPALIYTVLWLMGTWNSADKYSGQKIWSVLAKVYIFLVALGFVWTVTGLGYQIFLSDAVSHLISSKASAIQFVGKWCYKNNQIVIREHVENDLIAAFDVSGDASEDAIDKPFGPSVGSIKFTAIPVDNTLYHLGSPVSDGCDTVIILHQGKLLVADNSACGGLNVRFNGAYDKCPPQNTQ